MQCIPARSRDHWTGRRVLEQFIKPVGPAVDKSVTAQKVIHQPLALVRTLVREKGHQLIEVRRASGQIDADPAHEFFVARQTGGRHAFLVEPVEDEIVDEVLACQRHSKSGIGNRFCQSHRHQVLRVRLISERVRIERPPGRRIRGTVVVSSFQEKPCRQNQQTKQDGIAHTLPRLRCCLAIVKGNGIEFEFLALLTRSN